MEKHLKDLVDAARGGNQKAVQALIDFLRKSGTAEQLVELLAAAEVPLKRAALAASKKKLGEPGVLAAAARVADDESVELRRQLAELLEGERDPRVEEPLAKLLADRDGDVRAAAAKSAAGKPGLEAALLRLADYRDELEWGARHAAAKSLAGVVTAASAPKLLDALAHETDGDVRRALLSCFETLDAKGWDPESLPFDYTVYSDAHKRMATEKGRAKKLEAWLAKRLEQEPDLKRLRELTADMTLEAEEGRLPRAYGVDAYCDEILKTIRGKGPRAVVLLGEAGVGKTAVVNELTHRLLRDPQGPWRVVRFSPVELLADTRYLGEWQTRLTDLMKAAGRPKRVVLFIPNLQELADAARTSQSDINMATAMAPRIESGELVVIGEATPEAYRTGLGSEASLRRLFHPIDVKEATPADTRGVLEEMALDSGIDVPAPVFDRLLELAEYYFAGVAQPGRAAGLLRRVLDAHAASGAPVTPRGALQALSAASGVPVDLLDDEVALDLDKVRGFFETRVMGQPEAVAEVTDLVALVKAGLTDPGKPFGVLFFVGPTGVGKTELARALAEYLFGDPKRMMRFDMSEFATYESFERLIGRGSHPGLLTTAVRERPFSVLLFDEIEKAHPNVFDLCLQLFDAGRLTDAQGRTADFRRTIIVLTSNVGSKVEESTLGFGNASRGPSAPSSEAVMRELGRFFRPEFLNRLDRIVTFRPLALETAEKIARREVARVLERGGIARRGLVVDVDPAALALLLKEGYSPAFGARPLKRTVERRVLLPVARAISTGSLAHGAVLRLAARDGEVVIETEAAKPRPKAAPAPKPAVLDRVAELAEAARPLAERKSELLERQAAPGFWDDAAAARRTLDEIHRLDGVLGAVKRLQAMAASASAERLQDELDRVAALVHARDPRDLGDAYVHLALVKSVGPGLSAVQRLAGMYRGLAERRRLKAEVLSDDPDEDSVILHVGGAGAYGLLAGEAGLHQFAHDTKGKNARHRDVVRVDVLPAPDDGAFSKGELRVQARPLKGAKGRLLPKLTWRLELLHPPTMASLRAAVRGTKEEALESLEPLLRALADRGQSPGSAALLRHYLLGPSPLVRDLRTGRTSGKLEQVLDGALEPFLSPRG